MSLANMKGAKSVKCGNGVISQKSTTPRVKLHRELLQQHFCNRQFCKRHLDNRNSSHVSMQSDS